jgi:hypothetical protein
MVFKNSTRSSSQKRVAVRRDSAPNDPYTARKAAREAAKAFKSTRPTHAVVQRESEAEQASESSEMQQVSSR